MSVMGSSMTAGSDVRLNTERIEAVARAIYEWDTAMKAPFDLVAYIYREMAEVALLAADAAGSWNDTERLRTALADLRNCAKGYLPTPHSQSQIARVFAAANAALAESVPSPQVSS